MKGIIFFLLSMVSVTLLSAQDNTLNENVFIDNLPANNLSVVKNIEWEVDNVSEYEDSPEVCTTEIILSDSIYISAIDTSEICLKAEKDAHRYYIDYVTAGTFTLLGSTCFILPGLITAVACTTNPPKPTNLGISVSALKGDSHYLKCYTNEAYKIKKKKIWKNFYIGSSIILIPTVVLLVLLAEAGWL